MITIRKLVNFQMDVTPKQQDVLEQLPATRNDIADELGISYRAVRYRMDKLEDKYDMRFERDGNNVWSISDSEVQPRDDEVKRINTYDKAQATKDINNTLLEIEKEIKEAIQKVPRYNTDFEITKGNSTLVIPRSDDHFGAKIKSRSINEEFTTEIAKRRIKFLIDNAIEASRNRDEKVEEVVLGLFGDHIEGETIFDNQLAGLGEFLREQIREVATFYVQQIDKLSDEFDNVKVVTCPGNHGRTSGVTNADDIVFDWIETGLQWKDVDNVEFVESNGKYVEFSIRGHDGYARHGTDALKHASTSSGDDRWMNWKEEAPFDVGYHGHHHQLRLEPVGHSQIFQCGTPVPPSLFVNSIGATGKPRVMYHFTTDENVIEGLDIIEF